MDGDAMSYPTPSHLDWLINASAHDTSYHAARTTDLTLLFKALVIVTQRAEKTKARIIEARIRKIQKSKTKKEEVKG